MPSRSLVRTATALSIAFLITACNGSRPMFLGDIQETLQSCPESPNCVSSLAPQTDETHYIAALEVPPSSTSPIAIAKAHIEQQDNAKIVVSSEYYLYAEYTSDMMKFVDDVELLLRPGTRILDVRSASRLGYRDFDVNRERIEALRHSLASTRQ